MGKGTKDIKKRLSHCLQSFGHCLWSFWNQVKYHSRWSDWSDEKIRKLPPDAVGGLSDVDILTLRQRIKFLNPEGLERWPSEHIHCLSIHQLRHLTPNQIRALATNRHFDVNLTTRFVKALSGRRSAQKFGELLHALRGDPQRSEKLDAIAETLHQLRDRQLRDILTVAAQTSEFYTFALFFEQLTFEKIRRLLYGDRIARFDPEYEQLSLEIERGEFENNMEARHIKMQLAQFRQLKRLSSLEPIAKILKEVQGDSQVLKEQLNIILRNASSVLKEVGNWVDLSEDMRLSFLKVIKAPSADIDFEQSLKVLAQFTDVLAQIEGELLFRYRCLQEQNMTVGHFSHLWRDEYLSKHYERQMYLFDRQFEKDEITGEQYRAHILRLHNQAVRDTRFIHESFDWFTKKVRLNASIGQFSVEFLSRLIRCNLARPTCPLLSTREFERLMSLPGMVDLYTLGELRLRIGRIQARLARRLYRE